MAFFKNLWTFLTETIFLKDERNYRNGLIRWGVRQYKLLFYTARGLDEHDTLVRSAALTFYTLMSIVPIAALVFAVVKGFGLADGLMQNLYSLFPHNREVVDYLITFADKALAAAIKVHDSLWESGTLSYDMSQYEIARTYFQWLCDHCRYDNAAADDSASHLAYGALVSGLAVCDGYTGAYNLLLKLEGIECTSLFNDSHIWTLATLDGTQYHIDVTWGDQYGRTDLRYFGMSEEQSYQCHPWGTADKKK